MKHESIHEHPLAERFYRLTPDEVAEAVEVEGRRCTGRFTILNSYENRVYQLELEDGATVIGKFYRPGRWSREAILEEHAFLAELAAAELPVACPVELHNGSTLGEVVGITYAIFPRVSGRAPQELSDAQVRTLGSLLARIHNVGALHPAPSRGPISAQTYGRDELQFLVDNACIPAEARTAYVASVEALVQRIEPLFEGVPTHRIHGDCHLGNLLWGRDNPTFVDFDDMRMGPAVQDVWLLVPSADDEGRRQRELLVDAYRQFRNFSDTWMRLVEPLRALRFIHYSTWIARRANDPSFKRTFSEFGTVQYWQREIQDLREQIARIDVAAGWS
jgi:Ser/Thr protein kinase RdoA (MazF antagonist)